MKNKILNLFITLVLVASAQQVIAQGTTAFTFQGQLNNAAGPAAGNYDLTFAVWDATVAGNKIAGPITNSVVAVSNGLFTVTLDFGAGIFTGTNYWIEMGVRTNGGGNFLTLAPRQQLTPAPYALSLVSPQATALCPPGAVIAFAGATPPSGWLLCDGSAPSRTTFAALFAAIGTTYGPGDSSTTFNLPDMRGRTGIGAGQGSSLSNRSLGQTMGEETHTLSNAEMPVHNHGGFATQVDSPTLARPVQRFTGYVNSYAAAGAPFNANTAGGGDFRMAIPSDGGSGGSTLPHNNMQPSLVLNYIIKY